MRLEQLLHVITIAEEKSMNKAARSLYVSQPTLSLSIQSLEAEVGFKVFQRTSRGMLLTPEGDELYHIALKVQKELNRIHTISDKAKNSPIIRIDAAPAFCGAMMFPLIRAMEAANSAITLNIQEIHRDAALDSLLYSDADFAIGVCTESEASVLKPQAEQNQLKLEALVRDRLVAYLPKTHELAYEDSVSMDDLRSTGMTMLQQDNKDADISAPENTEFRLFSERDSVLKGVSNELGYAIMPSLMTLDNLYINTGMVRAIPLRDGQAPATLYLAYAPSKQFSPYKQLVYDKIHALCHKAQDQINQYDLPRDPVDGHGTFTIIY